MQYNKNSGLLSAFLAYFCWGLFPIYWKLLGGFAADEVLAHRILWSFVFLFLFVRLSNLWPSVHNDYLQLIKERKRLLLITAASVLIAANWFIYIWAVNQSRIIETSLGYYINPLVNVLIGIAFLGEKMNRWQMFAIVLAALGVLNLALSFGSFPWIAVSLALTMGLYGLCKKLVHLNVFTGMTVETMISAPFALAYIIYLSATEPILAHGLKSDHIFLLCSGIITPIPLLLFANAANKLPLSILGLVQYISPTLSFLLGVFLYNEKFTVIHMQSFSLIWAALLIFSLANTDFFTKMQSKLRG